MITNQFPLKSFSVPSSGDSKNSGFASRSLPSHWHVSNFIADILSKALLSLFADFYSPLKNSSVR
jgi:hypothetical protein